MPALRSPRQVAAATRRPGHRAGWQGYPVARSHPVVYHRGQSYPEKFSAPETFDITRDPNLHIAFGSGIHHCLGATLARVEGQDAFKALAQRFPALHLETEELDYRASVPFR